MSICVKVHIRIYISGGISKKSVNLARGVGFVTHYLCVKCGELLMKVVW